MSSLLNFSDFAKLLFPVISNGKSETAFSRFLLENITDFSEYSGENPVDKQQDTTYRHYFNGTRQLTKLAPQIINYIDVEKFAKYIEHTQAKMSTDSLDNLKQRLAPYCEVRLQANNLGVQAAYLFRSIILASCESKSGESKSEKRNADKSVINRVTLASQARAAVKGEKGKENVTEKIKIADLFDSTQHYTFDIQQVRAFASCGKETTVFKIDKSADKKSISLTVNFEKTRLRDEIPEYAGVYFLKHPPIDISKANQLCFQARSVDESIQTIFVEIKPEGKAWMHESFDFCVSSEFEEYVINLTDFVYPETMKCLEEITFVIKPNSFVSEDRLAGKLDLAELYIK